MARQPKYLTPYWKARIDKAEAQASALAGTLAETTKNLEWATAMRSMLLEVPDKLAECDALIDDIKVTEQRALDLFNEAKVVSEETRREALDECNSVVRITKDSKRYPHYGYFDIADDDYVSDPSFIFRLTEFMCKREHRGLWFSSETFIGYRRFHLRAPKAKSIVYAKLFLQ